MLTKEERMQRVKEARKAYSTRPPRRSRSLEAIPRASIAPSNSAPSRPVTRPVPFKFAHNNGRNNGKKTVPSGGGGGGGDVEEFKVDPKSMEMIESGNVVITNNSRPSLYNGNRYRNTLGGGRGRGGGGLLQPTRFRNSIAPAEPRVSLLPLGINIFSATAAQRAQVEGWMKQKCEAATPAGKKASSSATADPTKSVQKVRFQESPDAKDAEEDGGEGKAPIVHTPYVSKFDKNGSFLPPTAMRSALKNNRMNVNTLAATPIPAARKLNFDDMSSIEDDESSVLTVDKENSQNESSNDSNVSVMSGNRVQQWFRCTTRLTQLDPDQLTPEHVKMIDQSFEMLKNYRTRIRMMGGKGETQTARAGPLVPITENEDDEEEEEEMSDAFGALRIRATSPAPRAKPNSVPATFGLLGPISEDF